MTFAAPSATFWIVLAWTIAGCAAWTAFAILLDVILTKDKGEKK